MIVLDGHHLSLEEARQIVFGDEKAAIHPQARTRVEASHSALEQIISSGETIYGINTGFGQLSTTSISEASLKQLQKNIVLSHAVGVGEFLPEETVRAMLLFRTNSLLRGDSGVRLEVIEYLIDLLNHRIHPRIPAQGSVGSSGDLCPLAHLSLILVGEGLAEHNGEEINGKNALVRIGRVPLVLGPKEGLALLNGTQYMTGLGFSCYVIGKRLLANAVAAASLSLEAMRAFSSPFAERLQQSRPHVGQVSVAAQIRLLLSGSQLIDSAAEDVQDPYSLRCIPQVLGPAWEALSFLSEKLKIEINSATDNPLIFPDGTIGSGGNFHGQIVGLALEMFSMAFAEIGSIAERRIDKLLTSTARGLPTFLVEKGGLNSGLMLTQYVAASLVSENKVLCHPALVDSIPTSGGKEDHNSMASISARKALQLLTNLGRIIAIEYLCAAQALDFRDRSKMAPRTRAAYERVRRYAPHLDRDRILSPEIECLARAVSSGELINDIL
jgi:histidine ammonia-lyase